MFSFFQRVKARAITDRDLVQALTKLRQDLDDAREEHQRLRAEHLKLRGRVYALWGSGKDPEEASEATNLQDPRLTKAQVRAALIARGALTPQKPS